MKEVIATDAGVEQAIEFLTILYQRNLTFSGINTVKSMLSAIFKPVEGVSIWNLQLRKRLMKGFSRFWPSLSKYTVTYDANIAL